MKGHTTLHERLSHVLYTVLPSHPTATWSYRAGWEVKSMWPQTQPTREDSITMRTMVLKVHPQPAALLSWGPGRKAHPTEAVWHGGPCR